jgi:hypothetical protein
MNEIAFLSPPSLSLLVCLTFQIIVLINISLNQARQVEEEKKETFFKPLLHR